ncbi:hypothetical protein N0V83_006367 [Neocucurbitaria cava]|uniref:Argonaute linker 2 domain-containing protein n=1 Tax=Neocucurbitaria cava TaxID=798079 RepID=A0A9W9CL18_9PLEO|nr:hypothetical protein N0V83_006367 [Neocucurbitaria cava]
MVVSGQPPKAKLDGGQTQQMIRHAVRKPWENAASIVEQGIQTIGLNGNTNMMMRSSGLTITSGLIKVPGCVLNGPKVIYTGNKSADLRFGSWNMINTKFNTSSSLNKWSYLLISLPQACDAFDQQGLAKVMQKLYQGLVRIGVNATAPLPGQRLQLQHPDDPALGPFLQRAAGALSLLFIILPEANVPLYQRIKNAP